MSTDRRLSRGEASEATDSLGWRFVLGALRTQVPAAGLADAAAIATAAITSCGASAQEHLSVDIRGDRVLLRLRSPDGGVFESDAAAARAITAELASQGRVTSSPPGGAGDLQAIEIAIDALDIVAIRPFWKAVTGYVDEPGAGPEDGLVDPLGCGPPIWFQQIPNAIASTWTSRCRTTSHGNASTRRCRPAANCAAPRRPRPSGSSPTPKATKPVSAPGRAATNAAG